MSRLSLPCITRTWSLPIPWLTSTPQGLHCQFPTWCRMTSSSFNPIPSSQVQVQSQKELSLLTNSESMILEPILEPINEIREIENVNQPGPSHSLHPLIPPRARENKSQLHSDHKGWELGQDASPNGNSKRNKKYSKQTMTAKVTSGSKFAWLYERFLKNQK